MCVCVCVFVYTHTHPTLGLGQICIGNWVSGSVKNSPSVSQCALFSLTNKAPSILWLVFLFLGNLQKTKRYFFLLAWEPNLVFRLKAWKCWHLAAIILLLPLPDVNALKLAFQNRATWLILPVVICLSKRLSHACLSINCLYK